MKRISLALAGLVIVLAIVFILLGMPVGDSLRLMVLGAAGDKFGISASLTKSIPLMLCALGIVISWRAGMYNIGGEGQFIMGGIAGGILFQLAPGLPPIILNLLILICGFCGGALYAWLAGWLFVKRGVQVVISTILLNFVAIEALSYVVTGPLKDKVSGNPVSVPLPEAAMAMRFDRQTDLHSGIFIAIVAAVLVAAFLLRTRSGYVLRLVGESSAAARANRVDVGRQQILAISLSGALCGLAGVVEYVGTAGQLSAGFSQNWGFLAIPVALLGGLNGYGAAFASLLFGGLFAGSDNLARFTKAGSSLVYIVQAVAVLGYLAWRARSDAKREVQA